MDRFQPLDVTNSSIGTVLYHDEEVITLQSGVGLYDGKDKALHQASGTIYLTSHRLIYVDEAQPHKYSCHLSLELVKATEYYVGFFKSSPKITLFLAELKPGESSSQGGIASKPGASSNGASASRAGSSTAAKKPVGDWRSTVQGGYDAGSDPRQISQPWTCRICGFNNRDSSDTAKCQLCGVARDRSSEPPTTRSSPAPQSRLSSSASSQTLSRSPAQGNPVLQNGHKLAADSDRNIACPTCTFLNHPSMLRCEMCDSTLATVEVAQSRPDSAAGSQESAHDASSQGHTSVSTPDSEQVPKPVPQYPWSQKEASRALLAQAKENGAAAPTRDHVKLSFRKGGEKEYYDLVKSTLKSKAWARSAHDRPVFAPASIRSDIDGRTNAIRKAGIDGIISANDSSNRAQNEGMADALKDLEALMQKAKQMVDLAENLNKKLIKEESVNSQQLGTSVEGQVVTESSEAATLIRSSLVRLGLPAPAVTEDMAKDELDYHMELARELGRLLLGDGGKNGGLMGRGTVLRSGASSSAQYLMSDLEQGRGLISLDEAWCVWNRARGVALVPPKTLRTVATFLAQVTNPPISFRQFTSGLCVLHTPRFSEQSFEDRLLRILNDADGDGFSDEKAIWGSGKTSIEIARSEDAPILLVTEMIEALEISKGTVARDDGAKGGTRWYPNAFRF